MALIFVLMLTIGIMTALGIAALMWGVDSRPTIGDDHAR
jgi:nitrogen fixation-related uncharacterized protein